MTQTPEERAYDLVREGLENYESPLRTLVWLQWSWRLEPRGDSDDVLDIAEHILLRTMSRAERGLWMVLRGQSLDFEEALDLATAWEYDQHRREQEYQQVLEYVDAKPRKQFPWKMLSPREEEAMRRKAE